MTAARNNAFCLRSSLRTLLFDCLQYVVPQIRLPVSPQVGILGFDIVILFVLVKFEDTLQFRLRGMSENENYGLRYVFITWNDF